MANPTSLKIVLPSFRSSFLLRLRHGIGLADAPTFFASSPLFTCSIFCPHSLVLLTLGFQVTSWISTFIGCYGVLCVCRCQDQIEYCYAFLNDPFDPARHVSQVTTLSIQRLLKQGIFLILQTLGDVPVGHFHGESTQLSLVQQEFVFSLSRQHCDACRSENDRVLQIARTEQFGAMGPVLNGKFIPPHRQQAGNLRILSHQIFRSGSWLHAPCDHGHVTHESNPSAFL